MKKKNININRCFVIIASVIGIAFSILYPLYQIPDELTHIDMIYSERNLNIKFLEVNQGFSGTENIARHPKKTVNINKYFDLSKKIDYGFKFKIPKVLLIRHFPQFVGMLVGEILHLPVLFYITFCELTALFFYIFICNKALKKIPFKKDLFMMIMLLPVCCQQMASFSYDVMLNSFSFLYIASIFECVFCKDKVINKDFYKLFLMLFVIFICKIPYVLLAFLIFIIPRSKVEINIFGKKIYGEDIKIRYFIIFGLFLILLLFPFRDKLLKISIFRIFLASLKNFTGTIFLYYRTFKIFVCGYFETIVGNLGWFDVKVSIVFEVFVYLSLFILTFNITKKEYENNKYNFKQLLIIFIVIICLSYVIILAMFEWTLFCTHIPNYEKLSIDEYANYISILPYIGGVQGRYFIPIIPLILIPMKNDKLKKITNKINPLYYQLVYYIVLFVYLSFILLNRYWI